jgi:hypothetical protein
LSWAAVQFYGTQATSVSVFLSAVIFFLALIWLSFQFYLLPYLAIQEETSLLQAYRNAIMTSLADPLLVLFNGGLTLFILIPSIVVIAPIMLIVPMVIAMIATYSLLEWLQKQGIIDPILPSDDAQ